MDTSSFDDYKNVSFSANAFSDLEPISKNGATSACFKVRIHGKWHFLKRPKMQFSTHPIYIAAFDKEFDLGFTLDHPNIVRYLNKGADSEGNYILSEYIDGLTLIEFINQYPFYFKEKANVLKFANQLFSALSYLHARQIVHLDLKPDNILITRNGHDVKLIDLGMSYSDCYTQITGGSPTFGSPEQFADTSTISFRCDIYAAGKVLLFIATGGTDLKMVTKISSPMRSIVKYCLVEHAEKRIITADKCIEQLRKKNRYSKIVFLIVGFGVLILLFMVYNLRKTENQKSSLQQKVKATESNTKSIPTNVSTISPTIRIQSKQVKETINLEKNLHQIIKERLSPNTLAMSKIYSNINEYNYSTLFQSFSDWKELCNADCKQLYQTYQYKIEYEAFEEIYKIELSVINNPIELKFKAYTDSINN